MEIEKNRYNRFNSIYFWSCILFLLCTLILFVVELIRQDNYSASRETDNSIIPGLFYIFLTLFIIFFGILSIQSINLAINKSTNNINTDSDKIMDYLV